MSSRTSVRISTLAIFGVGLIGGSLALALKQAGYVGKVIGVGRSRTNLERALRVGAIDEIQSDPRQAVAEAEVIVLATPVHTIRQLLKTVSACMDETKIITDVGSVKGGIVEAARHALGPCFTGFVPGHPIAGKEKSGINAASAELFENHRVVLTPVRETSPEACRTIRRMWTATGGEVNVMGVEDHDRVLSLTSHLPHVLAYVMMDFLSISPDRQECYRMAAGGLYDFTRTASSDPEMWRDICLMNKPQLLEHIARYQQHLDRLAGMIDQDNGNGIGEMYASAKQARSRITEKRKTPSG